MRQFVRQLSRSPVDPRIHDDHGWTDRVWTLPRQDPTHAGACEERQTRDGHPPLSLRRTKIPLTGAEFELALADPMCELDTTRITAAVRSDSKPPQARQGLAPSAAHRIAHYPVFCDAPRPSCRIAKVLRHSRAADTRLFSRISTIQTIINQSLAALATPQTNLSMAHSCHTQCELDTFMAPAR